MSDKIEGVSSLPRGLVRLFCGNFGEGAADSAVSSLSGAAAPHTLKYIDQWWLEQLSFAFDVLH